MYFALTDKGSKRRILSGERSRVNVVVDGRTGEEGGKASGGG